MTSSQSAPAPNPAQAYEDVLVEQMFRPLSKAVLEVAPPSLGDRILDIACGTGIVLREAAAMEPGIGRLAGIDLNPNMIIVAREVADRSGLDIEFHEASADKLPFGDREFTRAYIQQGLQFFPDKPAALAEARRVLEPGGTLVVALWRSMELHPYVNSLNTIAFERTGVNILLDPFSLSDEAAIWDLFDQSGFKDLEIRHASITSRSSDPQREVRMQLTGATAAIPSLQKRTLEERTNLIEQVLSHAQPLIADYTANGVLAIDWHTNIIVARR